jgi:tetratricopeptide (TPR) repeat protein
MLNNFGKYVVLIYAAVVIFLGFVTIDAQPAFDGTFVGINPSTGEPKYYSAATSPLQINPVKPVGTVWGGGVIWYVNGILTDPKDQIETMKAIANKSGQPVIGIRNTSYGFQYDFPQTLGDLFGTSNNPATTTLTNAIYNELKSNRRVHLFGHSQGTVIIGNAIENVSKKFEKVDKLPFCEILYKLSLIKAELYASPKFKFISGPSYVHFCNYLDIFVCNALDFRNKLDITIKLETVARGYSKLSAEIYGAKAYRNNSAKLVGSLDYHGVANLIKFFRPTTVVFPLPPTCSAKVFLFDTSGSMDQAGKWDGELDALIKTLKIYEELTNAKTKFFQTSILSFAGECSENSARRLFDFTIDVTQLINKLPSTLPRPGGGTPLNISKGIAKKMFDEYLQKNPYIEKDDSAFYVLTDGEDTCSQTRPTGTFGYGSSKNFNSASTYKTYTIGYDLVPGSKGERDLQYMAFSGGGKYYNAADPRQLNRVFQKLTQSFTPQNINLTDSQNDKYREILEKAGIALQKNKDVEALKLYRQLEADFKRDGINSPELYFNLAQALEANDRYKGAIEYYKLYLKNDSQALDKNIVEQKIVTLKQDYKDQIEYYLKVIESDITYLKNYYKTLYNQQNDILAAEFAGFVTEKGEFYSNLQDVLEVKAKWLENGSKDLSDSLYNLSDRVDKPSFDRDAVSLLTLPISQLEEILETLNINKVKILNSIDN